MYVKLIKLAVPFTAASLISVPAPPNTPTCRIILLFSRISCHVCSFKAGGQLAAVPFVALLNLGIFSYFLWVEWLRDLLPSQQLPVGVVVVVCRVSPLGTPRGWAESKLSLSWWLESFDSAVAACCCGGDQTPAGELLAASSRG